jgi:hypothetical protein
MTGALTVVRTAARRRPLSLPGNQLYETRSTAGSEAGGITRGAHRVYEDVIATARERAPPTPSPPDVYSDLKHRTCRDGRGLAPT